MNIPLLRRVQKVIDKNPALFDMRWWKTCNECGTAYCIGGWGAILSGKTYGPTFTQDLNSLFDITYPQAIRLFNEQCWPSQFKRGKMTNSEEQDFRRDGRYAALGIARIEHFIQTNGEE